MDAARAKGTIALSSAVHQEIAEVLYRPKFRRILTRDRCLDILDALVTKAVWKEPAESVIDCRDAKDNKYLELALAAHAVAIMSGDDDLLTLDPWRGIRILTSAQFIEWIKTG